MISFKSKYNSLIEEYKPFVMTFYNKHYLVHKCKMNNVFVGDYLVVKSRNYPIKVITEIKELYEFQNFYKRKCEGLVLYNDVVITTTSATQFYNNQCYKLLAPPREILTERIKNK